MIKTFFSALILGLFATACSGESFDDESDADFGESEQGLSMPTVASGTGYGVGAISTLAACSPTSAGTCSVPELTTTKYCISGGTPGTTPFTAGEVLLIKAAVANAGGSHMVFASSGCGLTISPSLGLGSDATSDALSAYRSWAPVAPIALTETPVAIPSVWQRFAVSNCRIDMPDIATRAAADAVLVPAITAATRKNQLLGHAAGSCAAHSRGLGTTAISGTQLGCFEPTADEFTARTIQRGCPKTGNTPKQNCLRDNAAYNTLTAIQYSGSCI